MVRRIVFITVAIWFIMNSCDTHASDTLELKVMVIDITAVLSPINDECLTKPMSFVITLYATRHAVTLAYHSMGGKVPHVNAFHYMKDGVSQIHMMRIRHQFDKPRMETLGHEVLHGLCGNWHR